MAASALQPTRELEDLIEKADLHYYPPPERYEPGKLLDLAVTGVYPAVEGRVRLLLEDFVGGGFAGQVYRVRVIELEPEELTSTGLLPGEVYAIKIHVPPSRNSRRFRDGLYWLGYQGAFPFQVNPDASRCGVLWQKLIRRGAKIIFGDERCVADTFATFFDPEMGSYGEVNEWVEGRTWRFELDSDIFNRGMRAAGTAQHSREYLAKKEFMAKFVMLLHEMGATELTRQYEWWSGKSQPNVSKRLTFNHAPGEGLTALDFRPGLALLCVLPMSPVDFPLIFEGLRRGSLVQFDRGNLDRLQNFCRVHAEEFDSLAPVLAELMDADPRYRESQPDITHHRLRLFFDGELRRKVKNGLISGWRTLGLVDSSHSTLLHHSQIAFILFYLTGALPLLGSFLRRWWGNSAFRTHIRLCCTSVGYLRRTLDAQQARGLLRWLGKGRIDEKGVTFFLKHPLFFSSFRLFPGSLPLPAKVYRCLTNWNYAVDRAKAAILYPIRFYRSAEFRAAWLENELERGEEQGMLRKNEKKRLLSQVNDPFLQKYLKCLAVHFFTVPTTRLVMVLIAVYAYINFGNSWQESLAYAVAAMVIISVLPVSPGSFLRGSYVVYLMIRERNIRNYWLAALVSYWHYIGYLGVPLQMTRQFPALARLLASRWVTRGARIIPVFGESGALLEHLIFDFCVNFPLTLKNGSRWGRAPQRTA